MSLAVPVEVKDKVNKSTAEQRESEERGRAKRCPLSSAVCQKCGKQPCAIVKGKQLKQCETCRARNKEYQKTFAKKHPNKHAEYMNKYYHKNQQKRSEYMKQWRAKHASDNQVKASLDNSNPSFVKLKIKRVDPQTGETSIIEKLVEI